jgi:hypothetical protein
LIASFVEAPFRSLGTDGFGRSDNRAALRRFFEIDRQNIVVAALFALAEAGTVTHDVVAAAIRKYGVDLELSPPWLRSPYEPTNEWRCSFPSRWCRGPSLSSTDGGLRCGTRKRAVRCWMGLF